MSSYAGINYAGPFSTANQDTTTGIRYGVISMHSLTEHVYDSIEYDYGTPHCPECGNPAIESSDETVTDEEWNTGKDFACAPCEKCYWSDAVYSDEPLGWSIDENGLQAINCLDSDAMVIKSPYYTYAQFCSPCVPGAGNLDTPMDDKTGAKCYAFGHDWFDGGIAPYPVYSVETGRQIIATPTDVPCPNCHGAGRDTVARLCEARNDTPSHICQLIYDGQIKVSGFNSTDLTFNCFRCDGKGTKSTIVKSEVQP